MDKVDKIEATRTSQTAKYTLFNSSTKAIIFGFQALVVQRMLDFDFLCQRKTPSVACIINPTRAGNHKCFWGSEEIFIPMYRTLSEAMQQHQDAEVLINFSSYRSAFASSKEALESPTIRTVVVIAEGVPENKSRELIHLAKTYDKWVIGPATVGGIVAGAFKIGNTGGTLEHIRELKLNRPGSVAYVSKSGGLSNELNSIIAMNTDGVYEGIIIGGDRYSGSTFMSHIRRYQENPEIKIIVLLGEVGGADEYEIINAIKDGIITKPVIAWCTGTCAAEFSSEVQFGHAGALANQADETAAAKNAAFKAAGAIVPNSFDDFGLKVKETYDKLVNDGKLIPKPYIEAPIVPQDYETALRKGLIRRPAQFISTISDERGDELTYCGVKITEIFEENYGLGGVIGLLWFKQKLPTWAANFLEMIVLITADHGPAVSGAHNAIVTTRAGKDLVSSLCSGLLTVGPRFGGAINEAASMFSKYCDEQISPELMVKDLKDKGKNIQGIGHRIKSTTNPDKRVEIIKKYASENFPSTKYLDYALAVESITTTKKKNLILNVDGCIGVLCCDMLANVGYDQSDIQQFIKLDGLNGFFVLGRSIGLIGHAMDQKRLNQQMFRQPYDDIHYVQSQATESESEYEKI